MAQLFMKQSLVPVVDESQGEEEVVVAELQQVGVPRHRLACRSVQAQCDYADDGHDDVQTSARAAYCDEDECQHEHEEQRGKEPEMPVVGPQKTIFEHHFPQWEVPIIRVIQSKPNREKPKKSDDEEWQEDTTAFIADERSRF